MFNDRLLKGFSFTTGHNGRTLMGPWVNAPDISFAYDEGLWKVVVKTGLTAVSLRLRSQKIQVVADDTSQAAVPLYFGGYFE